MLIINQFVHVYKKIYTREMLVVYSLQQNNVKLLIKCNVNPARFTLCYPFVHLCYKNRENCIYTCKCGWYISDMLFKFIEHGKLTVLILSIKCI